MSCRVKVAGIGRTSGAHYAGTDLTRPLLANDSVTADLVAGKAYVGLPAESGAKAAAVLEISVI
jgi:hypothetical protein